MSEEQEQQQEEIIKHVYGGGYAHTENLMILLADLEADHGIEEAIRQVHRIVVKEKS